MGGPLEDRLKQASEKDQKRDGGRSSDSGARGSSLGSIMKSKIRTQHQKVEDDDKK
jgi:hypothetical protein